MTFQEAKQLVSSVLNAPSSTSVDPSQISDPEIQPIRFSESLGVAIRNFARQWLDCTVHFIPLIKPHRHHLLLARAVRMNTGKKITSDGAVVKQAVLCPLEGIRQFNRIVAVYGSRP